MKQQQTGLAGWRRIVLLFNIPIIIVLSVWLVAAKKVTLFLASPVAPLTIPATVAPSSTQKAQVNAAYGKLPLIFEANQGQTDPSVRFLSRGPGYTLFLTPDAAVFSLYTPALLEPNQTAVKFSTLRMRLVDANLQPEISGLNPLPTQVNSYRVQDPKQWQTGIPAYAKVQLQKVYPGVDLIYYGNQQQLEYDFIVAPGADPARIRLAIAGLDETAQAALTENGDLVLKIGHSEIRWHQPVIYQEIAGQRRAIDGGFKLVERPELGDKSDSRIEIGFRVAAYDPTRPLIIDPVLAYSTFLGGMSSDYATSIAVDISGNAYVTGAAASTNFPSTIFTNGYDRANLPSLIKMDVFISKFDPNGQSLLFSTLVSGALPEDKDDIGYGIAVNQFGTAVYVVGTTASTTFPLLPIPGGYNQSIKGSTDAFIAEFRSSDGALLYSSYLGGGKDEGGTGIAIDPTGNIYVTGYTTSIFPTAFPVIGNVYQPNLSGGADAFVTKFSPGWAMLYSTYFGGSKDDKAAAIAVDSAGSIYITGSTASTNLNTPWAFGKTLGGSGDAFVAKFDPSSTNSSLIYSTYLGGSGLDSGTGIAVDNEYHAYVTGSTASSNFPVTPGVFGAQTGGGGDAFVTKIHPTGDVLIYSSYLGGSSLDSGAGIALAVNSSTGEIYTYVTGATASTNFPVTPGAFSKTRGGAQDAFLALINADFSKRIYATYLGGINNSDSGAGIAIDLPGRIVNDGFDGANYIYGVYVAGSTAASDFPVTLGAYDTTINSSSKDAFITKLGTAPVDLRVELVCPNLGSSGNPMSCSVKSYNDSASSLPTPAPATTFTVTVPSTVSFGTPYPTGCSVVTTTMTCSVGVLFPGVSPITRSFTITPTLSGSITITAQVAAAINDENTVNNTTSQAISIDKLSYGLVVTSTGTGNVTSSPSGINCGSSGIACSANFTDGASVKLTAIPTYFIGWNGACSGTTPTCLLTINTAKSVAATFTATAVIGVFRSGTWYLDTNGNGAWDGCQQDGGLDLCLFGSFGNQGDLPATGDWNGDGKAKVGVFRNGTWYLDYNGNGKWDDCSVDRCYVGSFGRTGDLPIAGDWNGDGKAKVGVFRNGTWYLDYNGNGRWDGCQQDGGQDQCLYNSFGQAGDLPAAGDWNGDGKAKVGVFRNGTWYLDYNGNGRWDGCQQDGGQDQCLYNSFGQAGDLPAAGDWNGDGKAKVGVFRNGTWYLDYNGNGRCDGCSIDRCYVGFGMAGDSPVAVQQ